MSSIIQQLVEIDRKSALKVEEAKKAKDAIHVNLKEQKQELYNQYIAKQEKELEDMKKQALMNNKEELEKAIQEFEEASLKMDQTYNEKKEEWIQELFNRCIEC